MTFIQNYLQLVSRVTEKTELAIFLTTICTNFKYEQQEKNQNNCICTFMFRFEVKNNWNDLDVITIDDELEALT